MLKKFLPLAAAATLISAPALAENCANTTFSALAATSCMGSFTGNINGSASEIAALSTWGTFSWAGKTDDVGFGPFTSNPGSVTTATLTFDHAISGKFVIGLKAATNYSYYLFNAASPITSLTFNTTAGVAVNRRGIAQGLSHAALYVTAVPEPETYAMFMAGLGIMGFIARRRKA